jgi:hypothetical protein
MKRSRKVSKSRSTVLTTKIKRIEKKIKELREELKLLKKRKSSQKRKSSKRKPKASFKSTSKRYTKKYEECVMALKAKQPKCMKRGKWTPKPGCYNPWAVCRSSIKRT